MEQVLLANEDLRLAILVWLETPADVQSAATVSSAFYETSSSDILWEPLCEKRWLTKACRFHLTPARRAELLTAGLSWKEQYRLHEIDGRRQRFRDAEELSTHTFDFRFRMEIDDVQSTTFRFESDGRVSGHPNGLTYHWTLTDNADGEQLVRLGNFPAARVKRLKTWQWLMCAAACHRTQHGPTTYLPPPRRIDTTPTWRAARSPPRTVTALLSRRRSGRA